MSISQNAVESNPNKFSSQIQNKNENFADLREELAKPVIIDGLSVLPFVQGGKGVGATNGKNAGAWAAENASGTLAAIGAAIGYGEDGRELSYTYSGRSRRKRHEEMIDLSIQGCILQAQTAYNIAAGNGCIRINFLKMAGGSMRIMRGMLAGTRLPGGGNMINAVTMGAGLPAEEDAQICVDEGVFLDPIISSAMALKVLLNRTFRKWSGRYQEVIGAVGYEGRWLEGGHNGLTIREDPNEPKDPYERVKAIRSIMNNNGMEDIAIIMAGGVWYMRDWQNWLDNPEIGPIAFQIGTRDLLTRESPVVDEWKHLLLSMKKGDVALNKFSPTGFFSSAYKNTMIRELFERSARQVDFAMAPDDNMSERIDGPGVPAKGYWVSQQDKKKVGGWINQGFNTPLRTPDGTLIFVSPQKAREIKSHKTDCVGCLVTCNLSAWSQNPDVKYTTGRLPDPRVHCIRKGLLGAIQGDDLDHQLIFAGHNAYMAGEDPFYRTENDDVFIPTVRQLIARLMTGN
ncbi:MAG: nitronate monooxygenase [Hyphomicrobiales bacterium]|nr:nitronate monooxygenase [Hyphomicrobiales bacterium]